MTALSYMDMMGVPMDAAQHPDNNLTGTVMSPSGMGLQSAGPDLNSSNPTPVFTAKKKYFNNKKMK